MWHDHFSVGVPIVRHLVGVFTKSPISLDPGHLNDLIADIGIVLVIVALVWVVRTAMPLAVKSYTIAALVIPSLSYAVGPRPRMLLAAFPVGGAPGRPAAEPGVHHRAGHLRHPARRADVCDHDDPRRRAMTLVAGERTPDDVEVVEDDAGGERVAAAATAVCAIGDRRRRRRCSS